MWGGLGHWIKTYVYIRMAGFLFRGLFTYLKGLFMTNSADPVLTQVEDAFKRLLWDNWVKAGLAALFSAFPWMSVWPLGPLARAFIIPFTNKLFEAGRMFLDLQAIAFKDEAHKRSYDTEMLKLKVIAHDKGANSDEFLKAREAAAAAMSAFTQYNR